MICWDNVGDCRPHALAQLLLLAMHLAVNAFWVVAFADDGGATVVGDCHPSYPTTPQKRGWLMRAVVYFPSVSPRNPRQPQPRPRPRPRPLYYYRVTRRKKVGANRQHKFSRYSSFIVMDAWDIIYFLIIFPHTNARVSFGDSSPAIYCYNARTSASSLETQSHNIISHMYQSSQSL